jgi:isoleucyl-tRNA synthetase
MNIIQTTLQMQNCRSKFTNFLEQAKALLAMLALLAPFTAQAEWQKVTTTDSGTVYIEDSSIKRTGAIRSFWSLLDYKTPQKAQRGAFYVSTRTHMEMDCRKELVHILQFSMHTGPMLTGEIIDTQGVMREWQSIPPDTPLINVFRFVCSK